MNRLVVILLCAGILTSSAAMAMEDEKYREQREQLTEEFESKLKPNQNDALLRIDHTALRCAYAWFPAAIFMFFIGPLYRPSCADGGFLCTLYPMGSAYIALGNPIIIGLIRNFLKKKLLERWMPKEYKEYCNRIREINENEEKQEQLLARCMEKFKETEEKDRTEKFREFVRNNGGDQRLDSNENKNNSDEMKRKKFVKSPKKKL